MGGLGSGRQGRQSGAKQTTDRCHSLDIRHWQREGLLQPEQAFVWRCMRGEAVAISVRAEPDRLILTYQHQQGKDSWVHRQYPVRLNWTPCTLGGRRAWFECPGAGCGRRVAILYLAGAGMFSCRHCHQLVYACQREGADDRAARRAGKIRTILRWPPGILSGHGLKPRGMHWRTFWRLLAQQSAFIDQALARMTKRLDMLNRRLGDLQGDLAGKI